MCVTKWRKCVLLNGVIQWSFGRIIKKNASQIMIFLHLCGRKIINSSFTTPSILGRIELQTFGIETERTNLFRLEICLFQSNHIVYTILSVMV